MVTICICMFCFFPFLCLKAQDVDFSLTREGNKVIYKVSNRMKQFVVLYETFVDIGTGSHLLVRYKNAEGEINAEILSVQDKHFIRVDPGESYVRSIDISRYVQNGIVAISAVANVSFDDERGKLKIVRMEKEIP